MLYEVPQFTLAGGFFNLDKSGQSHNDRGYLLSSRKAIMEIERRILVVDDEVRMADSLNTLLRDHGYNSQVVYSGKDAMAVLEKNPPDLVITDIKMSGIDGYDIMRYVHDNLPLTYVIVITGHANLESAIEAIHQSAFDYITKPFDFDKLKASVEKAFIKLEIEQFREDMMSMLTHDIKVPLQSIIGYANELYNRETDRFHPRAPEFVENLCIYSTRVMALVDNFLTSCKIESGKLFLCDTEFDFNYFIHDIVAVFEIYATQRSIKVEVEALEDSLIFVGDEHLLFRAISNILNNAIKFSPKGSTVHVRCNKLSEGESPIGKECVTVSVTNPGKGIPREELPNIFKRYKRTRDFMSVEGSGLGLFVVKSVMEAHHGTVYVESRPDEYTTFTLVMPLRSLNRNFLPKP